MRDFAPEGTTSIASDFAPEPFLQVFADSPEIAAELLRIFCDESPGDVRRLQAALAAEDSTALAEAAHRIKGSLSYFDAEHASNLAAQLETMGRSCRLGGAATLVEELGRAIAALTTAAARLASREKGNDVIPQQSHDP